jgi:hypothetical protein
MKRVHNYIDGCKHAFSGKQLFTYLRDENIEPRRRLAFIPHLAHFVMTFADLYELVLPERPPHDRFQELINIHVSEDATHWKWFLADLTNAGLDPTVRFTDALRFVWNNATVKTRMLSYELCRLTGGLNSMQKFVLIVCIEATGNVALGAVATTGRALEPIVARKLVYFGGHHVETENQHTLENPAIRRTLDEIVLTESDRQSLYPIVDQAFQYFGGFVDEIFQIAQSARSFDDYV